MNKKYLLSSVTAGIALLYANQGMAQCVSTQDCATLGYTETSCPNGGVKCPFGDKWICISSEITPEQCDKLGFKYTCSGTGMVGGLGRTCDGKYVVCNCSSNYAWKNGACVERPCLESKNVYNLSGWKYAGCRPAGGSQYSVMCTNDRCVDGVMVERGTYSTQAACIAAQGSCGTISQGCKVCVLYGDP